MTLYFGLSVCFSFDKVLRDNGVTPEDLNRDDDDDVREHPTPDIPMEHYDSRPQNQHEHESIIPEAVQVNRTLKYSYLFKKQNY